MKKTISAVLLAALLLSVISCGEAADAKTETTAAPAGAEETTSAETNILDYLPAENFNGQTFTILTRIGAEYEFEAPEQTGDLINDAIYQRNMTVEERYNTKIKTIARKSDWGASDTFNKELIASVMAGDQSFNIVAGGASMILGAVEPGLFLNWYDIPNIDVSKPWWSPQIADSLTINNRMYAMTGDISLSMWKGITCLYFNKTMAEDYSIGDLYGIVKSGSWTFDKFLAGVSKVSRDLDGDSEFTGADMYGYISWYSTAIDAWLPAFDIQVVKRGDDGLLHYTINSERTVGALEKMKLLFFNGDHYAFMSDQVSPSVVFMENRALFLAGEVQTSEKLRDMEVDYGILPHPKYDDNQDKYYSTSMGISLILIPSTVEDTEFVGTITEALCAISSDIVIPAYYDTALKDKYNRDKESAETLDIIRDNMICDAGYMNSYFLDTAGHLFVQLVRDAKTDFASAYAKKEKSFEKKLAKMMEAYVD